MKFSDAAKAAVKHYVDNAGIPKGFSANDETDFKMYLGMRFSMELDGLKPKDLSKEDRMLFDNWVIYKDKVKDSVFKDACNEISLMKAKDISALVESTKKRSKKKHKKKRRVEEDAVPVTQAPVVYRSEGPLERAKNWVLGKMLDASIAINDWLIEH